MAMLPIVKLSVLCRLSFRFNRKMGAFSQTFSFLALLFALWVGFNVYRVFKVPPMPEVHLDKYWGPGQPGKTADTSIRPFTVEFKQEMVKDLKDRLVRTRPLTKPLEGVGFQYGFNSDYLTEVIDFWRTKYDFAARQKYLNMFPQFVTNIQGLDIHFLHIKPKNPNQLKVVPLILLHGWPGSFVEFHKTIPYFVSQREGKDFVFEVVVPSLPGYGYSQEASKTGLGELEIAIVMRNLMERLNYMRFVIQGGDWGSVIGSHMATVFPDQVIGYHSNFAIAITTSSNLKFLVGSIFPSLVLDREFEQNIFPLSKMFAKLVEESGYLHIQSTKPDTIGAALLDSPAGLAAYILEKFCIWTNPKFKSLRDGGIEKKFILTELIDNLMVYWDSRSIVTSARLYAESDTIKTMGRGLISIPTEVPTAIARFEHEMLMFTEGQYRSKYPNLLQLSDFPDGGHFAALEYPETLSNDLWSATHKFLEFHQKKNTKIEL